MADTHPHVPREPTAYNDAQAGHMICISCVILKQRKLKLVMVVCRSGRKLVHGVTDLVGCPAFKELDSVSIGEDE